MKTKTRAAASKRRSSAIPQMAADFLTHDARESGHDEGAIKRLLADNDPELNKVWDWIAALSENQAEVDSIAHVFVVSALQARGWSKMSAALQAEFRQNARVGAPIENSEPWHFNVDHIFTSRKSGVQTIYLRAFIEHLRSNLGALHSHALLQKRGAAVAIATLACKVLDDRNINSKLVSKVASDLLK